MINTAFKRKKGGSGHRPGSVDERSSRRALIDCARMEPGDLLRHLGSSPDGLSDREAALRLRRLGPNSLAADGRRSVPLRILDNIRNPLVILLIVLGAISYATGDIRATIMISVMVVLGVVLRFAQEARSDRAAEKLKSLVAVSATVIRDGVRKDVPASAVVPGDILLLSAGDMVPADVLILESDACTSGEAALTGEPYPVEKRPGAVTAPNAADASNALFRGAVIQTGEATALVIATGRATIFGSAASALSSLVSSFSARFMAASTFPPMSESATTTSPASPASSSSPSSLRSCRLMPAAAWPATAPMRRTTA